MKQIGFKHFKVVVCRQSNTGTQFFGPPYIFYTYITSYVHYITWSISIS